MSALDPQQLNELIDLMGDDLGNLVEAFLRDSADRLHHLQLALQQQDWDNARRQWATLKALEPGVCLSIPLGTHFQFRASATEAVSAVAITMPPWPGEAEAVPVQGPWPASGD